MENGIDFYSKNFDNRHINVSYVFDYLEPSKYTKGLERCLDYLSINPETVDSYTKLPTKEPYLKDLQYINSLLKEKEKIGIVMTQNQMTISIMLSRDKIYLFDSHSNVELNKGDSGAYSVCFTGNERLNNLNNFLKTQVFRALPSYREYPTELLSTFNYSITYFFSKKETKKIENKSINYPHNTQNSKLSSNAKESPVITQNPSKKLKLEKESLPFKKNVKEEDLILLMRRLMRLEKELFPKYMRNFERKASELVQSENKLIENIIKN